MKEKILLVAVCILIVAGAHAQTGKADAGERTTELSAVEEQYDVKHLVFNLHVADTSVYLWGDVTTTAVVATPILTSYVFELNPLMDIDSALFNGIAGTVSRTGNMCSMVVPGSLTMGTSFTVQVFYHGWQPAGGGFFNGLTHSVSPNGTHMIYTVSDPWEACNWWPAKQSATDKIDSVDMFVTVPQGQADGSNGSLVNIDSTTNPGFWTYHWQTHYAIDYYLISIAVSQYAQERSYMHFSGSSDSMLVQHFFMDTANLSPIFKARFDSVGLIIDYYSSLFGRYPYWHEKYGMCWTSLPGGMEHQTMTTIGDSDSYIIAHELMHQWFGDHVTYADWGEMWLSEGFACFAEQLFLDHFWGPAAGLEHRNFYLNDPTYGSLTQRCGEIYVTDTSGPSSLFFQPTVYFKGQGVVTMLRKLAPSDSVFFLLLRTYQSQFGFRNARVADMNALADSLYGFSLDSFFHQWIYGKGYPEYEITWDQSGGNVMVKLVQFPSCASGGTRVFYTPVELQFRSAASDTTVIAYNTADTQMFVFNWDQPMDSLVLNPDVVTICKQLTVIQQDTTLRHTVGISTVGTQTMKVIPNPAHDNWTVDGVAAHSILVLTDLYGRELWRGVALNGPVVIPAASLAPGNYLLRVCGAACNQNTLLTRW